MLRRFWCHLKDFVETQFQIVSVPVFRFSLFKVIRVDGAVSYASRKCYSFKVCLFEHHCCSNFGDIFSYKQRKDSPCATLHNGSRLSFQLTSRLRRSWSFIFSVSHTFNYFSPSVSSELVNTGRKVEVKKKVQMFNKELKQGLL